MAARGGRGRHRLRVLAGQPARGRPRRPPARIAAALPPFVLRVGVFVDAAPRRGRARDRGRGRPRRACSSTATSRRRRCRGLPRRVLKAVRVGPGFRPEDALRYEGRAAGILLDTRRRRRRAPGGTGRAFDWTLARAVRESARFLVLAGGLTPENVGARAGRGARRTRWTSRAASSGARAARTRRKVRAFVRAVRAAER